MGKIPLGGSISIDHSKIEPSPLYSSDVAGKDLKLVVTNLLPAAAVYAIQWLRNGAAISGATGESDTLVKGDLNKEISVQDTSKDGYTGSRSATVSIPATYPDAPVATAAPGDGQVTFCWETPFGGEIDSYSLFVYTDSTETYRITGNPFSFNAKNTS